MTLNSYGVHSFILLPPSYFLLPPSEVAKFEKKIGWLEDKPESNANLRAIDELYEKKEEQEDLMQPYEQMEQFYHGIFTRLTHADHDFMIIGADGPRSSRHRADYYTNVYDTHEVSTHLAHLRTCTRHHSQPPRPLGHPSTPFHL